ncbi:hypothetical protein ElyMa_004992500 [Elysia marginata]|uniref:TNFR-Cys domain-containing protein n=1 Tax=Elysia marginata TaxID=1093978 RepID=A0AAV4JA50_9GAST|nr:hypothetical protein ElyMa_004992500 [Elysia marginata]
MIWLLLISFVLTASVVLPSAVPTPDISLPWEDPVEWPGPQRRHFCPSADCLQCPRSCTGLDPSSRFRVTGLSRLGPTRLPPLVSERRTTTTTPTVLLPKLATNTLTPVLTSDTEWQGQAVKVKSSSGPAKLGNVESHLISLLSTKEGDRLKNPFLPSSDSKTDGKNISIYTIGSAAGILLLIFFIILLAIAL